MNWPSWQATGWRRWVDHDGPIARMHTTCMRSRHDELPLTAVATAHMAMHTADDSVTDIWKSKVNGHDLPQHCLIVYRHSTIACLI